MSTSNNNWCVYVHTNKTNGKTYVGITSQTTRTRWGKDGLRYLEKRDGKYIHSKFGGAVEKYGWEGFKHEVLFKGLSNEQANKMETELIIKFNSIENGYNCNVGGTGLSGWHHSEESKKKIRESNVGQVRSLEVRRKMSESKKGKFVGENSPSWGIKRTKESRKKMSDSKKGKYLRANSPSARKVKCVETGLEFYCIKDANDFIKETTGVGCNISQHLMGNSKSAGGYTWEYC